MGWIPWCRHDTRNVLEKVLAIHGVMADDSLMLELIFASTLSTLLCNITTRIRSGVSRNTYVTDTLWISLRRHTRV